MVKLGRKMFRDGDLRLSAPLKGEALGRSGDLEINYRN